jgi:hypothetical protein
VYADAVAAGDTEECVAALDNVGAAALGENRGYEHKSNEACQNEASFNPTLHVGTLLRESKGFSFMTL